MTVRVRAGQVWASCDPRDDGRRVQVIEVIRIDGRAYAVVKSPTGRRSRIRVDRLRPGSTGYRLVRTVRTIVTAQSTGDLLRPPPARTPPRPQLRET